MDTFDIQYELIGYVKGIILQMNYQPPPDRDYYNTQVWNLARKIPYAKIATYGQLGQMLSPPCEITPEDYRILCPRWVGEAMAACPPDVPWHRVINSQGKISPRADMTKQKRLLEDEGLIFIKDKLDLKVHQWGAPEQAATATQTSLF